MDVSSRRLALVLHRHLAECGLLSFLRLLRAFLLHAIKRNQTSRLAAWLPVGADIGNRKILGIGNKQTNSVEWHLATTPFHQHVRLIYEISLHPFFRKKYLDPIPEYVFQ